MNIFMRFVYAGIFVLFGLGTQNALVDAQVQRGQNGGAMPMSMSKSNLNLRDTMRQLWEDHIFYTRNYVISAVANLEDKDAVADRLLRNQDDIGDAIKPYYGNDAGEKLSALLRDHITIATEVVAAAKSGDKEALKKSDQRWRTNADDIAAFLSGANPNWPRKELTQMMYTHLDLLSGQVVSRINKDWKADISYYDKGESHILMMADTLTDGIVAQFPDRFKGEPPAAVK